MKELGIAIDFKSQTITIDEITLPRIASTSASTLRMQKLDNSLAKEPMSTRAKRATWTLDTKDKKADLQSIFEDNCKHLSANH
jgi:hypothetical protein